VITHPKSSPVRLGRRPLFATSVAVAAVVLAAAGCSNGSGNSAGTPSAGGPSAGAAPAGGPPAATGALVSAQPTSLGTILVTGKALTVYDFAGDTGSTSTCTGACIANWPFVPAPAALPASLPGVTGKLGTTVRSDGGHQLTIAGHPVYTFVGDSAPGQTNGQGKVLNGGLWTVVSPAGAPLPNAAAAAPPASSGPSY
jgi:predicted lipoprotein with Yx(FWY)xxD motif